MSPVPQNKNTGPESPLPAVIVGGSLNALGVVRSLGQGRMPIYLIDYEHDCIARRSRRCHFVAADAIEGEELITALAQLAERLACRPVLILTDDQSVNSVSADRGQIEPLYRLALSSHETVTALSDKTLFQEFAEREGFPVPRSVCLSNAAKLEEICDLKPPLIVKPADKTLVLKGLVERAVQVDSLASAHQVATDMLGRVPQIIVQEWIPGPDTELFFTLFACSDEGQVLGLFTGRKLVCSPPAIGSTALCAASPDVADELVPITMSFIARVGYRGLGSLEFKRDQRNGRFLIIEPTVGRTDWQEEIATLCGVNLPLRMYCSQAGARAPDEVPPPVPGAWRQSFGFRSVATRGMKVTDAYFRWSDPAPALYYYCYERGLRRVWRRAARLLG